MDFSKEVFNEYWDHKIDENQLCNQIGSEEDGFNCRLNQALLRAYELKDAEMVENLFCVIFICEDRMILSEYVDVINKLILCSWHKEHEDAALLLEEIADESSVEYLYQAIYLQPEYLAWDDNYAFEVKCIWGLGMIATKEAKEKLEILKQSSNPVIKENAMYQLDRLKNKK